MRIEYQGHVQARPAYQHVGYTVAALGDGTHAQVGNGLYLALAIGLALAALVAARVLRPAWRYWLAGALLLCGVCAAARAVSEARYVRVCRPYYLTLYRLERLSAATEDWSAAHGGRLPTPEQWRREIAGRPLPGWRDPYQARSGDGRPLCYATLKEPYGAVLYGADKGQALEALPRFVIWVPDEARPREPRPASAELTNWHFGLDGLAGTADDELNFRGAPRHRDLHPGWHPHGRLPRPTPAPSLR